MSKIIVLAATVILFPFLFVSQTYAAISFSISNPQADGDEVSFDVSLSGLTSSSCPNTSCYLQAAFTAQDQTKYFGFTKNKNGQWYQYDGSPEKDHIKSTFFSFEPQDGSWSGKLTIKVDPQDSDYNGPGNYTIKAWRYTGNSNSASGSSDNNLSIQLDTPTPSPSPTPTAVSSTKSTSAAKSPSPQAQPQTQSSKTQQATVLGEKESTQTATPSASPSPTATSTPSVQSTTAKTKIASYLAGSGLIVIGLSIGLFLWFNKRLKTNEKSDENT